MPAEDDAAAGARRAPAPESATRRRWRWPREQLIALGFSAIVALIVALALAGFELLAATRAYAGAESLWSKAHRSAVESLDAYAGSGSAADWQRYEAAIAVPLALRAAREALEKPAYDPAFVRGRLVAGHNDARDADAMIRLFRFGRYFGEVESVLRMWAHADGLVAELTVAAEALKQEVRRGPGTSAVQARLAEVHALDRRQRADEMTFPAALGKAARLLQTVFGALIAAIALLLVGTGVVLARLWGKQAGRVECELRESEARFRSLWVTSSDAILIVDTAQKIVYANPAAGTLFGCAARELVGQPLATLQPERLRGRHREGMRRFLAGGERRVDWRAMETVALHRDGRELPVEMAFSEVLLGEQRHFVGFLRDIGVRKRAEETLRHANELLEQRVAERTRELTEANVQLRRLDQVKSEFLATMSHELRTPLNAILGFSGLLRDGVAGPVSEEQRRQLGFVHGAGQHLLALINDLLDVSRVESGRLEVSVADFDAASLLPDVMTALAPQAQAKGLPFTGATLAPALPMRGDRRKCFQILLNLASNAVKFTEQGAVRVSLGFEDAWLAMTVTDTGIGIAAEQLPLLFEPFRQLAAAHRRSHEGTGLGLYLCRKLAEAMGGTIAVESTPGAGSIFEVRLPRSPQAPQQAQSPTRATVAVAPQTEGA